MKLYYSPGACSLAVHIALSEAGFNYESESVDLREKRTKSGKDYWSVNPKGYVPALVLDSHEVLTEAGVILQYLADQKGNAVLAPQWGTLERFRLMEWLHFIATELHKGLSPLWDRTIQEANREFILKRVTPRLQFMAEHLKDKKFVMGENFTILDAYLYTILNWTHYLKVDLASWPSLKTYVEKVSQRPSVQKSLKEEGLIK